MLNNHVMDTYHRLDLSLQRGQGVWVYDNLDKQYLDATSGYGVCGLGHAHPAIAKVMAEQSQTLIHTSNLFQVALQNDLAKKLAKTTNLDSAYFCNSGTEANEAALKLVQKYAFSKNISEPTIIVLAKGFHGRTLGAWSATPSLWHQDYFQPIKTNFHAVSINDQSAINALTANKNIVAVLLEPILGVGGVDVASPEYLHFLRRICDEQQWLLIIDEVQTGIGRTGSMACYQHAGIVPDIATFAKCLGNGYPIGACLATEEIGKLFKPGDHGSTFAGSPLACRVGLEVLKIIETENLLSHVNKTSSYIFETLNELAQNCAKIKAIKGKGLMIGIECTEPCDKLVNNCQANGLLVTMVQKNVMRLLPPLIINQEETNYLLDTLRLVFGKAK